MVIVEVVVGSGDDEFALLSAVIKILLLYLAFPLLSSSLTPSSLLFHSPLPPLLATYVHLRVCASEASCSQVSPELQHLCGSGGTGLVPCQKADVSPCAYSRAQGLRAQSLRAQGLRWWKTQRERLAQRLRCAGRVTQGMGRAAQAS